MNYYFTFYREEIDYLRNKFDIDINSDSDCIVMNKNGEFYFGYEALEKKHSNSKKLSFKEFKLKILKNKLSK